MNQFVCDGSCAGNELGDCNHGESNDGLQRNISLSSRLEALEMVVSCAKDVVAFWPLFSFRTIRTMAAKMETLKQALELVK